MNFLGEIMKDKRGLWILIPALVGLALIIFSPSEKNEEKAAETSESIYDIKSELEREVEELILDIRGVSDVSVMLTLDCGHERVYARNGSESGGVQHVIVDSKNGDSCVTVKVVEPRVRGAAVIIRGAGDELEYKVVSLISALFSIPTNKIYVTG